jgi:hypothetical protein
MPTISTCTGNCTGISKKIMPPSLPCGTGHDQVKTGMIKSGSGSTAIPHCLTQVFTMESTLPQGTPLP